MLRHGIGLIVSGAIAIGSSVMVAFPRSVRSRSNVVIVIAPWTEASILGGGGEEGAAPQWKYWVSGAIAIGSSVMVAFPRSVRSRSNVVIVIAPWTEASILGGGGGGRGAAPNGNIGCPAPSRLEVP